MVQHSAVEVGQKILYVNGMWAKVLEVTNLGTLVQILVEVGEGAKKIVRTMTVNAKTLAVVA